MKDPIKLVLVWGIFVFLISIFSLNVFGSETETSYVYFNNKIILGDEDNNIEYYHYDYLGNVVVKTDEDGEIIWKADYEPFGETFNEIGNSDYRFTGKELDDTGLHYYGARYYDKDTGRFVSADSLEGDIKKPQTLNRYVYAINNPLKYVDPSGNVPKDSVEVNKGFKGEPTTIQKILYGSKWQQDLIGVVGPNLLATGAVFSSNFLSRGVTVPSSPYIFAFVQTTSDVSYQFGCCEYNLLIAETHQDSVDAYAKLSLSIAGALLPYLTGKQAMVLRDFEEAVMNGESVDHLRELVNQILNDYGMDQTNNLIIEAIHEETWDFGDPYNPKYNQLNYP